jgi:hypothetical protein
VCRTLKVLCRTDYEEALMTSCVATGWVAVRVDDQSMMAGE